MPAAVLEALRREVESMDVPAALRVVLRACGYLGSGDGVRWEVA